MRSFSHKRTLRLLLFTLPLVTGGFLVWQWRLEKEAQQAYEDGHIDWVVPIWRRVYPLAWKFQIGGTVIKIDQMGGTNPFQRHKPRAPSLTEIYLTEQAKLKGEHFEVPQSDEPPPLHRIAQDLKRPFTEVLTGITIGSTEFAFPGSIWTYFTLFNFILLATVLWCWRRRCRRRAAKL